MNLDQWNLIYAGLLAAGGAIGWLKAGSTASLVAGGGAAAVVGYVTHFRAPYKTLIVAVVSGALAYVMGNRFSRSKKFMPPGLIAISSVIIFVAQVYKIVNTQDLN